jgi:hypothetical protein
MNYINTESQIPLGALISEMRLPENVAENQLSIRDLESNMAQFEELFANMDGENDAMLILLGDVDYMALIQITTIYVKLLEEFIVMDDAFYRMLSLSAFLNPELYSSDYLKPHLDYTFRYYNATTMAFTNLKNGEPYINLQLNDEELILAINNLPSSDNFNLYNIIRHQDDYIVYKCDNMRLNNKKIDNYISIDGGRKMNPKFFVKINKLSLSDVYQNPEMMEAIQGDLRAFYRFSPELQNNNQNKNLTLVNLEKLSNLQMESYSNFVLDLDVQTLKYGL